MAAAADLRRVSSEDELRKCRLFRCFCCWSRRCSPGIPRIGPRSEYLRADADEGLMMLGRSSRSSASYGLDLRSGGEEEEEEGRRSGRRERPQPAGPASATTGGSPLWSVLVGCTSADHPSHNLRIHYFRVTGTGRVVGHNNDHLELFCGVSPIDDKHTMFPVARAATVAADHKLYIICEHEPAIGSGSTSDEQADEKVFYPKAFSLNTADKNLSTLPHLPFTRGSWEAISACGKLWVPLVLVKRGSYGGTWRLIVYELNGDCWLEVNSVEFPYKRSLERGYRGILLQGYVVLDSGFILLSFSNSSFFLFECASGQFSRVVTDGTSQCIPITGKSVHVKDDEMIYFIRGTKLFAYKSLPDWGMTLTTPIEIATIWPYDKEGYGFMVHLSGRMLCAVWINMSQLCGCATRHALITTLRITGITDEFGCFVPNGVDILHSTCRQIDMLRSNAPEYSCYDSFCFLQKCQDRGAKFHPSDLSEMGFYCPQVEKFSEMLTCCREFLNGKPEPASGVIALDFCKMATRSDFYFICQADQCSLLYQISTSGGKLTCSGKALEAVLHLDTVRFGDIGVDDSAAWYFVHRGSTLDVIPASPDCNHYVVDVERKSYRLYKSKRSKLFFSAVFRAGQYVVALCDTLQYVYILRNNFQWRRQKTVSSSVDVSRKVKISGFVDLIHDRFMISDFDTDEFFLFDLKSWEWFSVSPSFGLLSGRCIFAEGFIYTCSDRGLFAYELIYDDTSYSLDVPIMLDFSWKHICGNRRFLSFDSICKGEIDDSIVFCVVHGHETAPPSTSSHTLATTTVQVKLMETAVGTKMPVGVDHVDISVSSIVQKGWILTNYAFSV